MPLGLLTDPLLHGVAVYLALILESAGSHLVYPLSVLGQSGIVVARTRVVQSLLVEFNTFTDVRAH